MAEEPRQNGLGRWVNGGAFTGFISILIVINAVILGIETYFPVGSQVQKTLSTIDHAILAVFVIEIVLRLLADGWRFFTNAWSWFDLIIVAGALVGVYLGPDYAQISVIRALRILRVLRLLSVMGPLRRVVEALLTAIPGMVAVAGVMMLIFYVGAVMATNLFGEDFPLYFGNLQTSAFTLFEMMTLEGWSEPVREIIGLPTDVASEEPSAYWWAWLFFIPFIFATSFMVLNLIIAIVVNSMDKYFEEEVEGDLESLEQAEAEAKVERAGLRDEIAALREQVAALTDAVNRRG